MHAALIGFTGHLSDLQEFAGARHTLLDINKGPVEGNLVFNSAAHLLLCCCCLLAGATALPHSFVLLLRLWMLAAAAESLHTAGWHQW
jgi:hypothetical protein